MSRVVLVTGASSGIGKATAAQFAQLGDQVLLCGSSERIFQVQEELQTKQPNAKLKAFQFDLRAEQQIKATVEQIANEYQYLDVLINNAGVSKSGTLDSISLAEWNDLMKVNVTAVFLLCKYAVPLMHSMNQQPKKIVNVSSIAGRLKSGLAGVHYTTSKAAIIGFTRQLAQELAVKNIRVNAVCPAQTRTPMLAAFLNEKAEQQLKAKIPLGHIAEPNDVANVIRFLASTDSNYMTGAIVDVNGGQL